MRRPYFRRAACIDTALLHKDTGMTLNLENFYGLNSLGAGLVFLGLVIPTFFVSSFHVCFFNVSTKPRRRPGFALRWMGMLVVVTLFEPNN